MRTRGRVVRRCLVVIIAFGVALWLAFRPALTNEFGYALPIQGGLPCRLEFHGRHYDDDEQCGGINRSAWAVWYDARHQIPPGGICSTEAEVRRIGLGRLHSVGAVFTLLGPAHSLMEPVGVDLVGQTPTVLFVQDGRCYRPYALSGGP